MKDIKFNTIRLKENKGHGRARQISIRNAKYDLVALMDSDDLCVPNRFELQLKVFKANPEIGVLGGQIIEFKDNVRNVTGMREVPLMDKEIKKYIKKRCPFNQMTIMFSKQKVLAAGGYLDWYCDEDYYLWLRMYLMNYTFANIKDVLCYVRVNSDMYRRRGGKKYFESERRLQQFMLDKKIINKKDYCINVITRFFLQRMCPNVMRKQLYKFTRKKVPVNYNRSVFNVNVDETVHNHEAFSVAMCVYGKDNPQYFDQAIESILNQTCPPAEIILVIDGPIPTEIESVIEKYKNKISSF